MTGTSFHRSRWGLLLLAVFGLGALAILGGCTVEAQAELKTYSGINSIRRDHGLPPLVPDQGLIAVARARSRDMATNNYFSHEPPGGCNFACMLDANGVPTAYAGENIAWNTWDWSQTADVALQMWEDSPPHLENILNCHFERFGAGVTKAANGRVYFTMIFEGNGQC